MTFTVETGAGVPAANSYVSVEYADAYFADRAVDAWGALDNDEKESALIRGTDYIEQFYGLGWAGYPATGTQFLSWPRANVWRGSNYPGGSYWPSDEIPVPLKRAVCELALKASAGQPLAPDAGRLKKRTKVGPLEVEYEAGGSAFASYTVVTGLLNQLLGGGAPSGINRALVRS